MADIESNERGVQVRLSVGLVSVLISISVLLVSTALFVAQRPTEQHVQDMIDRSLQSFSVRIDGVKSSQDRIEKSVDEILRYKRMEWENKSPPDRSPREP